MDADYPQEADISHSGFVPSSSFDFGEDEGGEGSSKLYSRSDGGPSYSPISTTNGDPDSAEAALQLLSPLESLPTEVSTSHRGGQTRCADLVVRSFYRTLQLAPRLRLTSPLCF